MRKNQRLLLIGYIWISLKIPILNIYYLLCYAWDKLEEGLMVNVSESDYKDSLNLFAGVLVNGCRLLFKRGLDRSYNEITQTYNGIKGKIDFKESLNKNLFKQGRAVCIFDNLETDILANQILKATFYSLTRVNGIEKELRRDIWDCYWRFSEVGNIKLQMQDFSKVRIHSNNSFYDFLLKVCRLIFENTVVDEESGKLTFKDFVRSEKAMAGLFEAFIRNFYKRELNGVFTVRREDIEWDAVALVSSSESYLPKMQTDITLESRDRKIIIETKYYVNALTSRFEAQKLNTGNLYQLYSYLRNIESKQGHLMNSVCEGILLYPTVNYSLDEKYQLRDHILKVQTVDLNVPWQSLKSNILEIVK